MTVLFRVIAIMLIAALFTALAMGMFSVYGQSDAGRQTETVPGNGCLFPEENEIMNLPETSVIPNGAIPPIDASAPARTETATFSLG